MSPSRATLTAQQAEFYQLACFGALSRELRHEANNLLAVAGAWAGYRSSSDLTSLSPLLDKSADAVSRLTALERAIGMCALHKNGLQRDEALSDIVAHTRTILAPRLRVAGIDLMTDVPAARVAGHTGPWVLTLTLLLRHAIEEVAAAGGRALTLAAQAGPSNIEIIISGEGAAHSEATFSIDSPASDGPEFWAGPGLAVARHQLSERGGTLRLDGRNDRYILLLPSFVG